MISIKPKWMAKILNGEKTIEIRKSKGLYKATQKLIDEYGYAEFYVYCTKDSKGYLTEYRSKEDNKHLYWSYDVGKANGLNGNVIFKFRCYKVEEIIPQIWTPIIEHEILKKSCLKECELFDYICSHDGTKDRPFYAIHISDLEIFDRPKELSEFYTLKCDQKKKPCNIKDVFGVKECHRICKMCKPLTKAPQSMCYIDVE